MIHDVDEQRIVSDGQIVSSLVGATRLLSPAERARDDVTRHTCPRRRTRIVATLGPATDRPGVVEALLEAGLDVGRINFSHGTAEENCLRIMRFRQTARKLGRSVAVLADLPGPKLRALL